MGIPDEQGLIEAFRSGERHALARLLTRIENQDPEITSILASLYELTGNAWRIGVTGPPGAGKSTLVNAMTLEYRKKNRNVGVIAFDPTSPFTGGALLGDRVRMDAANRDSGIFIRSMATRGHLGGLAVSVDEACDLMDAFGKERIFIETVGVGQSELEVANSADTTIVVLVPESGDSIQAMKAGLMEIADIFILNKSDRQDSDRAYQELVSTVELKDVPKGQWRPPVLQTVAKDGHGLDELMETIRLHREHLGSTGDLERKRMHRAEVKTQRLSEDIVIKRLWNDHRITVRSKKVIANGSPYELAQGLVKDFYQEIVNDERF